MEDGAHDHHLPQAGLDRELGQDRAEGRELVVGVQALHISKHHLSLDDGVDRRGLDGLGQELADGAEAKELDGEGELVEGRPEHLRDHVLVEFLEAGSAAEVEAEAGSHSARASFALLQVGLGGPHGRIVGDVVVRGEEFHLGFAAVDDEDDIVDGERRFSDVRREDHLGDAVGDRVEHPALVLARKLRVQRNDTIAGATCNETNVSALERTFGWCSFPHLPSPSPAEGQRNDSGALF